MLVKYHFQEELGVTRYELPYLTGILRTPAKTHPIRKKPNPQKLFGIK